MAKVSMKSRYEVIGRYQAKYRKGTKKEKGAILDSVCSSTGISRSRAKHILTEKSALPKPAVRKRGRKPKYDAGVRTALELVWAYADFAGGKRLCAAMGDMLDSLIRFNEVDFDTNLCRLLCEISPATIDRLLQRPKERMRFKGKSTTKPGTLLKKNIPVRLGTAWNDAVPGFIECDLVAHCGQTTAGEYVNTLDVTDICSGWTETKAVINKAQRFVFAALTDIEGDLPFPLLGIDSDNGSEFINAHLYRYCKENNIVFTRSRPYMKNDGCHVEQKNWHLVRRNIGYGRYEGKHAVRVLNEYYSLLRLYTNFFQPQTKLISKDRDGSRIRKRYETPLTPYRRLLADKNIPEESKQKLREIFHALNPAALKRDMMKLLSELLDLKISE